MAINDINNKTDGIHDDLLPKTTLREVFRFPPATFSTAVNDAVELTKIDGGRGIMGLVGPYSLRATLGYYLFFYFYFLIITFFQYLFYFF